MALNPKDRERIIEEETLRYETRRKLEMEYCGGKHGYGGYRWGFWGFIKGVIFVLLLICIAKCACRHHGWGRGYCQDSYGCYDQMKPGMEAPEMSAPDNKDLKVAPKKK